MEYFAQYILVMFLAVCWIWGFNYCFKEGEIFYPIGEWLRKHVKDYFLKPTIDCPYCMSSVHGTIIYALFIPEYGWFMWVYFCFAICGLTAILDKK